MQHQRLFEALESLWSIIDTDDPVELDQDGIANLQLIREETRDFPDASVESRLSFKSRRSGDKITGTTQEAGEVTIKGPDKTWDKQSEGKPQGSVYEAVGHWRVSRKGSRTVRVVHFWGSGTSQGPRGPMGMKFRFGTTKNPDTLMILKDIQVRMKHGKKDFSLQSEIPVWSNGDLSWSDRFCIWLWKTMLQMTDEVEKRQN